MQLYSYQPYSYHQANIVDIAMPAASSRQSSARAFFSSPAGGVLFALLATVVWSYNFIASRDMMHMVPPITLAAGRWLVAFVAVLPFAWSALRRERMHFIRHIRYYLVISALGIAFLNTAIYVAAYTSSALNLSLIACTSPLFTVLLSRILFNDPLSPRRLLGIAVALAGVLLLISKGRIEVFASLSFQRGDMLSLLAALSFAFYSTLLRKSPSGSSPMSLLAVTFGLGLLLLLPFSAWELAHGAVIHFSPRVFGTIVYLGVGASLFSFWCWGRSIAIIGPAKASIVYYTLPLFCGVEAVLLLHEPVLWVHYAGGACILAGLLLATRTPGAVKAQK